MSEREQAVPPPSEPSRIAVLDRAEGKCVVTTRAVASGQELLVFDGSLCHEPGKYTLQVDEALHVESPKADWHFINHACAPNARIDLSAGPGRARLIAAVDLEPGQEVTFNYLTTEWDLATPFRCFCQAPHCVGWIRGARYLDEAQLAAFRSDFAPHILRLLRRTRASWTG
ncbi:SET domain-containing protein-lysine N-methyltransferase [Archangium lansingense]|uniref:SET domain-containing protein-lysine N-methyltransferase n=1 Tax=Archangium lansingense TaxID=2995310 RepID=A0ABT4AK64_9BACT|nr:SET domain-containing protein-lysine N-methyltransferase [Archangium lansinium]MCY1081264.1 SET domain-containing protein-lysine N-methyltransferase [Archangium lansinium]